MVAFKHFTLQAPRFDGNTVPASLTTGWTVPWRDINDRVLNAYVTEDVVGRFPPEFLGRTAEAHSLVCVWTDGPVDESTDGITVIGSSDTAEADPPDVLRRALTPIGLTPESATVIQLAPYDDLGVNLVGVGDQLTLHVTVIDMSGSQIYDWFRDRAGEQGGCCTVSAIVVEGGSQQLAAWTGRRIVKATMSGPGRPALTLPEIADLDLTKPTRLLVFRDGGERFIVLGDGDDINGVASPEGIVFEADNMGVCFEPSSQGWVATFVVKDMEPIDVDDSGGAAAIDIWDGDKVFDIELAADGPTTLPSTQGLAADQKAYVANLGMQATLTLAALGENVNGIDDDTVVLPARGDAALLVRDSAGGYRALRDTMGLAGKAQFINNTTVTHTAGWRGRRTVIQTAAGASTQTLPPSASTPVGCTVYAGTTGAGGLTVGVSGAADRILGLGALATTVATAQNLIRRFEFLGNNGTHNIWQVT